MNSKHHPNSISSIVLFDCDFSQKLHKARLEHQQGEDLRPIIEQILPKAVLAKISIIKKVDNVLVINVLDASVRILILRFTPILLERLKENTDITEIKISVLPD